MEKIKELFGTDALTYEQFTEKLGAADKKTLNLANLAAGGYVGKDKFAAKEAELQTAQQTIKDLQDAAKKWDGVDVEKLKGDMAELQTKYNKDIAAARLDNALNVALLEAKAKDTKLVKSLLDMSVIKQDGESLTGLKEQLEAVTKSHAYLFDVEESADDGARVNTGANHKTSPGGDAFLNAFRIGAGLKKEE